ncbi:Hsp20/alpha crystallin family protein [Oceanobacillus salinisoli]|uniref:Hsp20/alpha crystallin family protein n=1 Tax=Oceanobacillus salinisoli TaxID=2678611 RepID=UPI001E53495D|nr:Hsp20/alpha crystallin family protein [Oceanobacillus salinisoli]
MKKGNFPEGFDIDMTPLHDFMRKMDSMFNESFKHLNTNFKLGNFHVDVDETEKDIMVKAELPGYSRDQIKLEIIGNRLKIAVEDTNSFEGKDEKKHYYSKQESFQRKERIITVPFNIPEKETKASFKNGLLKVVIPKRNSNRKFIDIDE